MILGAKNFDQNWDRKSRFLAKFGAKTCVFSSSYLINLESVYVFRFSDGFKNLSFELNKFLKNFKIFSKFSENFYFALLFFALKIGFENRTLLCFAFGQSKKGQKQSLLCFASQIKARSQPWVKPQG